MISRHLGLVLQLPLLACLTLAACSSSNETKTSSLKYQYVENGCDTGVHVFSSQADYCNALKDSSLNNGCAYTIRKQTFEANCQGHFDAKSTLPLSEPISEPISGRPPQTTEPASAPQPAPAPARTKDDAEPQPQPQPNNPSTQRKIESLTVVGTPKERFSLSAVKGEDTVYSFLSGQLTLQIQDSPSIRASSIRLTQASKIEIKSPDLGTCQLQSLFFGNVEGDETVKFQLDGLDAVADMETGCASKFMTMQMNGLTVEFSNVPLDFLSNKVVSKLTLKVTLPGTPVPADGQE